MLRVRLFILILCALAPLASAAEWTLIKQGGRDYVTLQNVADFYRLDQVSHVRNGMTLRGGNRRLRGSGGSPELFINDIKFILSYPLIDHGGNLLVSRMDLTKLIEPVLRPSKIKSAERVRTIILDAGHGGHDRGAVGRWGDEKSFNLDVARRARALLLAQGYEVLMTRNSDVFIPLNGRTAFANKHTDDALFISIHFNSGNSGATGVETFTLAPRGVPSMAADGPRITDLQLCAGNARDAENMALATATHAALVSQSGMYDRGIKRARFVVIRDIKIPGVLIEGGFVSNASDGRRIASSAYRDQMAQCISLAVRNYRNAVSGTTPAAPTVITQGPADVRRIGETVSVQPIEPRVMIPRAR